MHKTLLPLFLFISLLILSPISSLATDDTNNNEPPTPEEIETLITSSAWEELRNYKPSDIIPADVETLRRHLLQMHDRVLPHQLGGEQIRRDENGQKIRNEDGKVQKKWVRGPLAKAGYQTRHFPAEALVFYAAIGATMATQAYYESKLMGGRTNPDWLDGLYHELTSPVGLFSFYCFLLASGHTGYWYARIKGPFSRLNLEGKMNQAALRMAAGLKAGQLPTQTFLKEQKKLQSRLAWHQQFSNQLGLAVGIMASNIVTESYYLMQSPSWNHCIKEISRKIFRTDTTLSPQNGNLQCDLLYNEIADTTFSWFPAVYSVLSASVISAKIMNWSRKGAGKIKGVIPFIRNLSFEMTEETFKKLQDAKMGKYFLLPGRTAAIKVTQGLMKFINLFMFMEIDQQITHKIFNPINKRGHIGYLNYYLFGNRSAVSGGHLGDLRDSIEDFIEEYSNMDPNEDSFTCTTKKKCKYHPVLASIHENAQQFSQLRGYFSALPMAAYNNWLLSVNNIIGSITAAENIYKEIITASSQAIDRHSKSSGTNSNETSDENSSTEHTFLFNQEHYFISEEDSLTDYKPILIKDMRKTSAEISELRESVTKLEEDLEKYYEENTSYGKEVSAKYEEKQTLSESKQQITMAEKISLFEEALDELRKYKNANNINCQNQTAKFQQLELVSSNISPHPNYYFLQSKPGSRTDEWTNADRTCLLEAMFNTVYSFNNIEPFFTDMVSAQQQVENIIRTTMGGISEAEELRTWSRDLLRKRILSAGLELLSLISTNRRSEIYNKYAPSSPASNYGQSLPLKLINDQTAQDFFVKLHKKMKVIRSYPRGALYTKKLNDYYKEVSESQGYTYTPAPLGFNMFRNPRIMDFILASFLCGQKDEMFDNATFGSIPQDLTEGKHMTDIIDDRLPALHRNFFGMRYTMNPPRFPFLKLNNQELDSICAESIDTTASDFGAPINNSSIHFDNKSYANLLHLVLDNIDIEKLKSDQGLIAFREEQKQERIKKLESKIVEYNNNTLENIVKQNITDIHVYYQFILPQISKQDAEEGKITIEKHQHDIALSQSIVEAIQNDDLEYLYQKNDDWEYLLDGNILTHYLLYMKVLLQSEIEAEQAIDSADFSEITSADLFQIWWAYKIAPSIEIFLELANEEFNKMTEFQFPGPLFQSTISEVEVVSQSIMTTYDSSESANSQQAKENSNGLIQLFPSLVKNNQLDHFMSITPLMSASFGGFIATPSPGIIREHKHILKIPEGIFANIHFEMTYWADLIIDLAKRKKEMNPDFNVDLNLLRKQLNKFIDLHDVDKMRHEYEQNGKNILEIRPFNHEERTSSQICTTIGKGTVSGFIKDFFRAVQVSPECKKHYNIFSYYWSSDEEDAQIARCLRMIYLPTKIGEHLGIDTNVLYSRRMSTDEEKVSSFFADRDIHENKSSDSDTLLDQLLKYALVRLQILEEEMNQAVDMRWRPDASRKEAHTPTIDRPTTMNVQQKQDCDHYTEEFDALIEAEFTIEDINEAYQLIPGVYTPIIPPTKDDPLKLLQQLPLVIDLP